MLILMAYVESNESCFMASPWSRITVDDVLCSLEVSYLGTNKTVTEIKKCKRFYFLVIDVM